MFPKVKLVPVKEADANSPSPWTPKFPTWTDPVDALTIRWRWLPLCAPVVGRVMLPPPESKVKSVPVERLMVPVWNVMGLPLELNVVSEAELMLKVAVAV